MLLANFNRKEHLRQHGFLVLMTHDLLLLMITSH